MSESEAARQAWELSFELFRRHRAHMRALQDRFGLAPMDLHALRTLVPGESMPVGRLAQRIFCDPPNIVKVIGRLVDHGLLTRTRDDTDARVRQVLLTKDGERIRAAIVEAFATPPPYITELTGPEQRNLRDLLTRMLSAPFDAGETPAKPLLAQRSRYPTE